MMAMILDPWSLCDHSFQGTETAFSRDTVALVIQIIRTLHRMLLKRILAIFLCLDISFCFIINVRCFFLHIEKIWKSMVDFYDKCSARIRVRVERCKSTEVIEETLAPGDE
jgi:hypothetical protein